MKSWYIIALKVWHFYCNLTSQIPDQASADRRKWKLVRVVSLDWHCIDFKTRSRIWILVRHYSEIEDEGICCSQKHPRGSQFRLARRVQIESNARLALRQLSRLGRWNCWNIPSICLHWETDIATRVCQHWEAIICVERLQKSRYWHEEIKWLSDQII